MIEVVYITPNTPEWIEYRKKHLNASDAPAMMSVSSYRKRGELVQAMATGVWPEPDEFQAAIYAMGHQFEAWARKWLAEEMGMDFFPLVCKKGKYSASLDGLTMDEVEAMEHKMLNEALRAAMTEGCTGADLPMEYQVQMEHQCMVSEVERVLFVASDWTKSGKLNEIRYCWYTPNLILRAEIERGWEKLEADVQAYDSNALEVVEIVGEAPVTLPALRVQPSSMVIKTNVDAFKALALARISEINMAPKTDQEWADAKESVRWNQTLANRIDESIELLHKSSAPAAAVEASLLEVKKAADKARIALTKMIEAESLRKRQAIATDAATELKNHAASLNQALGADLIPEPTEDFLGAMRNKRTEDSQKAAVAAALTDARMAVTAQFEKIRTNMQCLEKEAAGLGHLFPDRASLLLQEPEFVFGVVCSRLREEEAREEKRRAEALVAEVPAVAVEVPAVAIEADLQPSLDLPDPEPELVPEPEPAAPNAPVKLAAVVRKLGPAAYAASPAQPAQADDQAPTMTLGQISNALGFQVSSTFAESLGFTLTKLRGACHLPASQFGTLCDALVTHIEAKKATFTAPSTTN